MLTASTDYLLLLNLDDDTTWRPLTIERGPDAQPIKFKHGMITIVIAFYLPGNIPIYTYTLSVALGACAGLFWISQQKTNRQADIQFNAGLVALSGALIGGRLAYVGVNWGYFQNNLLEIIQVQLGGLAWAGALVGGMLALGIYSRLARQPLGKVADAATPLLGLLALSVWVGCWFDGCAYGPLASTWWAMPTRDEWGAFAPRLPLQLICAALTAVLFWALDRYARGTGLRPGMHSGLALLGLCLILSLASLLRADPAPHLMQLRLETWIALILMILTLFSLIGINSHHIQKAFPFRSFNRKEVPHPDQ